MSDQDGFDARLAARFEQEHRHVPADAFVAETMQKIRAGRRRQRVVRISLRAAALVAAVTASPWLIAGAERLNASVESSLNLAVGLPGTWIVGGLAIAAVMVTRLRRR